MPEDRWLLIRVGASGRFLRRVAAMTRAHDAGADSITGYLDEAAEVEAVWAEAIRARDDALKPIRAAYFDDGQISADEFDALSEAAIADLELIGIDFRRSPQAERRAEESRLARRREAYVRVHDGPDAERLDADHRAKKWSYAPPGMENICVRCKHPAKTIPRYPDG